MQCLNPMTITHYDINLTSTMGAFFTEVKHYFIDLILLDKKTELSKKELMNIKKTLIFYATNICTSQKHV